MRLTVALRASHAILLCQGYVGQVAFSIRALALHSFMRSLGRRMVCVAFVKV